MDKPQRKFMKVMKNFPSVLRTQYGWALKVQKDPGLAEKFRTAFEKQAKRYPYPAEIQSERELMELLAKAGE